jgi:ABC-type lipoprotein export system ATPase subunit
VTAELLTLERVTKTFLRGRRPVRVFEDVSFGVDVGDYVGVHGERLSGKTTLLLLCAGLDQPDCGVVRFKGRAFADLTRRERERLLQRELAFVSCPFEQNRIERSTTRSAVVDHVARPLRADGVRPRHARSRATELLEELRGMRFKDAWVHELSPGELTFVTVARSVIRNPALLLVDEPELSPNPAERDAVRALLAALGDRPDLTLIVASQTVAALRSARRIFGAGQGSIRTDELRGEVVRLPTSAAEAG